MSRKMTIVLLFKSGKEVRVKCEKFDVERNGLGVMTGFSAEGISENKFLHVDMRELDCIYRVISDE